MNVAFKFMLLCTALSMISIQLRAKNEHAVPVIKIAEHMPEKLLEELKFYAEVLGINDSATIQVRYSLRLRSLQNGLIQYRNTGLGKERHQVMIWINRRLASSDQSMTLAHEMVHAAQYIHGKMSGNPGEVIWMDKRFDVERIPYEDRPWEKEAHARSHDLRTNYLRLLKLKKQFQSGIHPLPESL